MILRSVGVSSTGVGLVLLFLVVALGVWVLSEDGGPGGSVLATLFSGASPSGPSYGGVLAVLRQARERDWREPGMGSRLRGNDGCVGGVVGAGPFDRPFDGAQDRLRPNGKRALRQAPSAGFRTGPVRRCSGQAQGERKRALRRAPSAGSGQALRRCSGQAQGERKRALRWGRVRGPRRG